MGKKTLTVKVKALSPTKRSSTYKPVYAVWMNAPNGTEWRLPNTDSRNRKLVLGMAKKIRDALKGKGTYRIYRGDE